MGWSKTKVLDTGHELGHCELARALLDVAANKLEICVNWYKDEQAKLDGMRPHEFSYIITPDQADLFADVVAHLQAKASMAQDVEIAEKAAGVIEAVEVAE